MNALPPYPHGRARRTSAKVAVLALAASAAVSSLAQQAPDAGQSLRQLQTRELAPSRPGPVVQLPAALPDNALPGGATVGVTALRFSGNTVLDNDALAAAVGDTGGRNFDLAGLRGLAQRVTEAYRRAGYPFARAYLPAQDLRGGELEIAVVEGRFGRVEAGEVQGWFSRLRPGDVIADAALERATLVMADQPGVVIEPLVRPGQDVGTGDLVVNPRRVRGWEGQLSLDNHGNRYTGSHRGQAQVRYDSPFLWGDQFNAAALASDESQWLGSFGYSAPLGTNGLRGQVGWSRTAYELGQDFSALGATGTATTRSLGLSHPLLRSQQRNLNLSAQYQHKDLRDDNALAGTSRAKRSEGIALTLGFDVRDEWLGGGVSYGAVTHTSGRVDLDDEAIAADIASGRSVQGRFHKWTLDLARMQNTPIGGLSGFAKLSMQGAGKNLDSSEGFSLGGAQGVRAYPQGEASGDDGWLVQTELRWQAGRIAPFAFHDAGRVRFNADASRLAAPPAESYRSLAGAGVGVRAGAGAFSAELALAWRTQGGAPNSDTRQRAPRLWASARWSF
jgi:hemolysin activation/secretion protein